MPCTYLKKDATVCAKAEFLPGRGLCRKHLTAIPNVPCANPCGRVVSTKHGRPLCTRCTNATRKPRDSKATQRVLYGDIYDDDEREAAAGVLLAACKVDRHGSGRIDLCAFYGMPDNPDSS